MPLRKFKTCNNSRVTVTVTAVTGVMLIQVHSFLWYCKVIYAGLGYAMVLYDTLW